MVDVDTIFQEIFRTVGIQCADITFKVITGSIQDTKTRNIYTFQGLIRSLHEYEFFSIEMREPILTDQQDRPYRINSVTILLKKEEDGKLGIQRIFTDEEEAYEDIDLVRRLRRWYDRWAPTIDLIYLLSEVLSRLFFGKS